jgi:hypothetical protein
MSDKNMYRILIEVDENGNIMESVAVVNDNTEVIEHWFDDTISALEWVKCNGKLAILDN